MEGLEEFVIIETSPIERENNNYFIWTHNTTLFLIEQYKKYKVQVGTFHIRTMKKLWEVISKEFEEKLKLTITASNVENRWRVLERNYKKYIDNKNKTGRGRKNFEYSVQMDELFAEKHNIHPEIVLSTETIHVPEQVSYFADADQITNHNEESENIPAKKQKLNRARAKAEIVDNIAKEKISYYKESIKIKKEYFQKKLLLKEKKLQEIERQNNIMEERNRLLRILIENNKTANIGVTI